MAFRERAASSIRQVKHQAPAFSVECAVCVRAIKRTGAFSAALVSALPIHQSFRSRLGLAPRATGTLLVRRLTI